MKKTLTLFSFCSLFLTPYLAGAQMTSQEYDSLGQAVFQKGLYDKAVGYFRQATQADPANAQAFEDLGNAYMKQNDQTDAVAAYQKSLQLNPNNPTLKVMVDNLSSTNVNTAPAQTQPEQPSYNQEQPAQETIVIKRRRPVIVEPTPVNYNDGLAPMDHAKMWSRFDFGYTYSQQGDLTNSVNSQNAQVAAGNFFGMTNGNASMQSGGFNVGGELGFLLNPNNGIAIGVRYIQANDYTFNASDSAPATEYDNNGNLNQDSWSTTLTPYVVPITLDYYLFLPDSGGRFFLTAGVGYYAGTVSVAENYSVVNYEFSNGDPNYFNDFNNPSGDLTAGTVGFQFGIGRDFAVGPNFGVSLFARGRYAKISNFRGSLSDGNSWVLAKFSDGTVDIDNPANIGTNGETYATVDFTGFDIGASINWYSF